MKTLYPILFAVSFLLSLSSAQAAERGDVAIRARAYALQEDGSLAALTPEEEAHQFLLNPATTEWPFLLRVLRQAMLGVSEEERPVTLLHVRRALPDLLTNQLSGDTLLSHLIAAYPPNHPSEIAIIFHDIEPDLHHLHRPHCASPLKPRFFSSLPRRVE